MKNGLKKHAQKDNLQLSENLLCGVNTKLHIAWKSMTKKNHEASMPLEENNST